MLRLDYLSCVLTIASTVMVGRRKWYGWVVAGTNSIIICAIGVNTGQFGFVPANLFCLALYLYNIIQWRGKDAPTREVEGDTGETSAGITLRIQGIRPFKRSRPGRKNELSSRKRDRIRRGGVLRP